MFRKSYHFNHYRRFFTISKLYLSSLPNQKDLILPVIGIEFHAQIASSKKLFSGTKASYFGASPNSNVAPFDLGLPGTLPVLNWEPVALALKTALALECTISPRSSFDRKHYSYPDLANGFQITQNFNPLAKNGKIKLGLFEGFEDDRIIRIQQLQLEQDTAKTSYDFENEIALDFNRSGIPLMEIVTYPDIRSPEEAGALVKYLQELLIAIGSSHASLEQGSLRMDANVSVEGLGMKTNRVELKNIATVTGLVDALAYEIKRQSQLLNEKTPGVIETRGFDASKNETFVLRSKTPSLDYRFLPEGNLPILCISEDEIKEIHSTLPELPNEKRHRILKTLGCVKSVKQLVNMGLSDYFDRMCELYPGPLPSLHFHWLTSELFGKTTDLSTVSPKQLGSVVNEIYQGHISSKIAKQIIGLMIKGDVRLASEIAKEKEWTLIRDPTILEPLIKSIILDSGDQKNAKHASYISWVVGQVLKKTFNRGDPITTRTLVENFMEKRVTEDCANKAEDSKKP